jgi:hypothetical protein
MHCPAPPSGVPARPTAAHLRARRRHVARTLWVPLGVAILGAVLAVGVVIAASLTW